MLPRVCNLYEKYSIWRAAKGDTKARYLPGISQVPPGIRLGASAELPWERKGRVGRGRGEGVAFSRFAAPMGLHNDASIVFYFVNLFINKFKRLQ